MRKHLSHLPGQSVGWSISDTDTIGFPFCQRLWHSKPKVSRWHCGDWHGGRHGRGQGGWHGGGHGGFSTWSLPSLHISFAFVNPSPHHLLWIYHPPSFLSRVAERTNGGPAHQYGLMIHPIIKTWNIWKVFHLGRLFPPCGWHFQQSLWPCTHIALHLCMSPKIWIRLLYLYKRCYWWHW